MDDLEERKVMKNTWKTITLSTLFSLANHSTQSEKSDANRVHEVAKKLSELKRPDLLAMMDRADCRCLAKRSGTGLDISINPAGENG